MITYRCPTCHRPLEVDDQLAGKRAACPHCSGVSEVPARPVRPDGVPVARPAGGRADVATPGDVDDRATRMGLPPDSGPEQHVMTLHPVMFRARPLQGLVVILMILGGAAGVTTGLLMPPLVWMVLPAGFIGVVGLLWTAVWWVMSASVALEITNKRTVERRGLLSRRTREILHDKVQDLQVAQSFLQRVLKVGSIGISSAGESDVEIQVEDLPNPVRIREVIDAYREIG